MYTEEEAKAKWCPHGRMADCERGFGYNRWDAERHEPEKETSRCIGAKCMAWRWKPISDHDESVIRKYARDTSREMAEKRFQSQRKGYCGLSGSPSMGGE